jgi:hypothetical protein
VGQLRGRIKTSLKLLNTGTNGDGRRRKRFSVAAIQKEVLVSTYTNLILQYPVPKVPTLFPQVKEARAFFCFIFFLLDQQSEY